MPDNPVIIQARLTALRAARDTGVLTVRHGDTSIQYRSLAEIERTISVLESSLLPGKKASRVRYPMQFRKGL